MTLFKWLQNDIKKYTFIKDVKVSLGIVKIYYEIDGKTKFKKVPYRCTPHRLLSIIEQIKRETKYYEKKQKMIKNGIYDVEDKEESYIVVSAGEKDGNKTSTRKDN